MKVLEDTDLAHPPPIILFTKGVVQERARQICGPALSPLVFHVTFICN